MKSIINIKSESDKSATLNFVFVNYGDIEIVKSAVLYLQNEIKDLITSNGGVWFDFERVEQAEDNPAYLGRKHKFQLKTPKKPIEQKYIGYFEKDVEKLHKLLFSSTFDLEGFIRGLPKEEIEGLAKVLLGQQKEVFFFSRGTSGHEPIPYSKAELEKALKIRVKDLPYSEHLFDFTIENEYFENDKIASSKVILSINKECIDDITEILSWYNQVIYFMDINFNQVFCSSYISYGHPDYPIVHTALYDCYDNDNVPNYILGAEWSVYLSENILKGLNDNDLENLSEYTSILNLQNGLIYVSNTDIKDFDENFRIKLSMILEKVIIPAFSETSWPLMGGVHSIPKTVYVCESELFQDIPMVVFLYNEEITTVYDQKELNNMRNIETLQFEQYV